MSLSQQSVEDSIDALCFAVTETHLQQTQLTIQLPQNGTNGHHMLNGHHHMNGACNSSPKELLCHICNKKLEEPKLLECLHVFCKSCLNTQLMSSSSSSSSEKALSSGYNSMNSSIRCPQCKQETKVNGNGIDCLEDDYVLHNMLDMAAIEEMILACTSCKTKEKAVARCADCAHFLCPNCVSAHQYMRCFENHRVVRFEDIKSNGNGVPIHKPLFCKSHVSESLKYFCNTCDTPICSECIVSTHKQPMHNHERINEAEPKNIDELYALVDDAKDKMNVCQSQFSTLDSYLAELQDQLENARGSVNETYQSYKAILEKRRDDLLKSLDEIHANKELHIMEMHNSIDASIGQINDIIKFTERTLKNGNGLEILLLKKPIVTQLRNVFRNMPDANLNMKLKFMTDKKRFEKAVAETFGTLVNGKEHNYLNQFNSVDDTNLHTSPSSSEQDWLMGMANCPKPLSSGFNGLTGLNGHFDDPSPSSSQEWVMQMMNMPKTLPNGQFMDEQQIHSPNSPTTAEWLMNMANFQKNGYMSGSNDNMLMNGMNVNQFQPGLQSPIESNFHGLMNGNSLSNSRSQTPGQLTNMLQPSTNVLDEFMPFGVTNLSQNLTQLTKLIAPPQQNLANGTSTSLSLPSSSPPIAGSIDGNAASANLANGAGSSASANQAFNGNGNLNPPVRNGKMVHMQVRSKFGQLGPAKSQFNSPHGFCLGVDEEIIIADTNNHRIQVFDKSGEFKYQFGIPGREEGQLWYPRKVTVMRATGKFVVCDRGNERSRMQIFNKNGHFIKKIAIRYIDIVAGLAITSHGHIVAVDSVSPTLFVISEAGDLIKWFDCSDYMREPSDIAVSNNEFYVCDFKGHCVVVLDYEGQFLRRIGGENITNFPNGIDVSDAGDVLVGDSHGNRFHVAVFSREGNILSEFECPYVKVSRCCGLKITSEGYVVTLAKNNHHVLVLNTLYVS